MIELITNNGSTSHEKLLKKLLADATEVHIAVAFLKTFGLRTISPFFKKQIKFDILAGVNFGITDPEALEELLAHTEKSGRISAYLHRLDSKITFHPKIYLVKGHSGCYILIGSANLTNGGLNLNTECSVCFKCLETDSIWIDTLNFFNDCIDHQNADNLSSRIISIYKTYAKKQRALTEQVDEFPDVRGNLFYDLSNLKRHYDKLDKREILKDFKEKESHYGTAREVLDEIASRNHTQNKFKELLEELVGKRGMPGLWYSNGMFRSKTAIFNQQATFRNLIKSIKNNLNKSPESIYNEAKRISLTIDRVGPNFIGEIMMTYAPEKLANINRNPITVLRKEGSVELKSHSQSFNGKDYEQYNSMVHEISAELGLKNMLQADYFFNIIYQKIK